MLLICVALIVSRGELDQEQSQICVVFSQQLGRPKIHEIMMAEIVLFFGNHLGASCEVISATLDGI